MIKDHRILNSSEHVLAGQRRIAMNCPKMALDVRFSFTNSNVMDVKRNN